MAQQYEPDEFDQIALEGGPVGVHRAPRPWWTRLLPPLLAFVIAGLVALGIAMLLWNQDIVGPDPSPTPTVTVTPPAAEQTPTPEPTDTAVAESPEPEVTDPEPEPTQTEEPAPEILYDAQVHIRNGANIQGLAGEQQSVLEEAGYTNLEANNISSSLISGGANVVTYGEERLADTARAIADALGIDSVDGTGTPGGAEIEVLLASNPGN